MLYGKRNINIASVHINAIFHCPDVQRDNAYGIFFKYDTSFCIKINRYKTTNWLVLLSVLHGSLHCISSAV